MGKRKLGSKVFYQCDHTGIAMRGSNCYMPYWDDKDKLVKRGSYCNWESVVAAASAAHAEGKLEYADLAKVLTHIAAVTGSKDLTMAPPVSELAHMEGAMQPVDYHAACCVAQTAVKAVLIMPNGDVEERYIEASDGLPFDDFTFDAYLKRLDSSTVPLSKFCCMRKKTHAQNRDLTVFYRNPRVPDNLNIHATAIFKLQMYGPVLLVQQSRETCFMPRERYIDFSKLEFNEQYNRKRKKAAVCDNIITADTYVEARDQMQTQLQAFENKLSANAEPPGKMAKTVSFKHVAQSMSVAAKSAYAAA